MEQLIMHTSKTSLGPSHLRDVQLNTKAYWSTYLLLLKGNSVTSALASML
jgi:hypothetical protein